MNTFFNIESVMRECVETTIRHAYRDRLAESQAEEIARRAVARFNEHGWVKRLTATRRERFIEAMATEIEAALPCPVATINAQRAADAEAEQIKREENFYG